MGTFADIVKEIKPSNFIKWLKLEGQIDNIKDEYSGNVFSMCEYSCLFIAMLFNKREYSNRLYVSYCYYNGYMPHYFITFLDDDGSKKVIDLTISQFDNKYPKLFIADFDSTSSFYKKTNIISDIDAYCKNKDAFKYYIEPSTMIKPQHWFNENTMNVYGENLPLRGNIFDDDFKL